ncbi:hypothetical protein K0M31_012913 [Melipona bicolor]|uniref:Uncharacterized protein n=1 Tax=Melipona bicolor TaxID=60889 RepID=A0AA40FIQ3_9HYME|nr:hypothetical protein K0M31_012913 [Melipona bicolor]
MEKLCFVPKQFTNLGARAGIGHFPEAGKHIHLLFAQPSQTPTHAHTHVSTHGTRKNVTSRIGTMCQQDGNVADEIYRSREGKIGLDKGRERNLLVSGYIIRGLNVVSFCM